jgi:S-adenosylmethionine:tRNA ribosyltransferase-isomerase
MDRRLRLQDFIYELPDQWIAQHPVEPRDASKLVVRSSSGSIQHDVFHQIDQHLPEGSLVIVNNSEVIPCRLITRNETGGKMEIFLIKKILQGGNTWLAMGKPTKRILTHKVIRFDSDCSGRLGASYPDGTFEISFPMNSSDFAEWLNANGYVPLPPYIVRKDPDPSNVSKDRELYQTVYSKWKGSTAAPTAGLHFTTEVLDKLRSRRIDILPVTLHVGLGTFQPVKNEDVSTHTMHEEVYTVPTATYDAWQKARKESRYVTAVGTTTLRCLESFVRQDRYEEKVDQVLSTRLFIYPRDSDERYQPKTVDALITNFHQPGSTLFMLICALIGLESARKLYQECGERGYRFLSYGDASLLKLK